MRWIGVIYGWKEPTIVVAWPPTQEIAVTTGEVGLALTTETRVGDVLINRLTCSPSSKE
jgi:hypothetical protein